MAGRLNRRTAAAGACAVALAAVLSACGNTGSGSGGAQAPSNTAQNSAGTTVSVQLTEYKVDLSPKTFQPGEYTFVVKNVGHIGHSLEVEGQGSDVRLSHDVQPGQSGQLKITLKKGSYDVYCPIDGHKDLGMKTDITVGGGSTGGGGTPSNSGGY
ncbi:copper-binding protein [Streptomyces sp. NPDC058964]|uniref:copper-binding protein n=1 Tax=Streptomyces sp. NPDC058964 TaxID=3346681 RepID=UPI003698479A